MNHLTIHADVGLRCESCGKELDIKYTEERVVVVDDIFKELDAWMKKYPMDEPNTWLRNHSEEVE